MKNYYNILGIESSALDEDIKKAYRKLSTKLHPDKNNSDSFFNEFFKNVNEAYSVLSDKNKRAEYDRKLNELKNPKIKIEYVNINSEPTKPFERKRNEPIIENVDWDSVRKWKKIRNGLIGLNIFLALLMFVPKKDFLNQLDTTKNEIGIVNAKSGLNLRKTSSQNSEIILTIPFGEEVEILDEIEKNEILSNKTGNWYEVSYAGNRGWVSGEYVQMKNE